MENIKTQFNLLLNKALVMGLTKSEFQYICKSLSRVPNITEIGLFSAMYSEHCSYKSTKKWLKKLPVSGEKVIQGPGENAGIMDIGDGQAIVFKIESHNHPSYIEPYQGASTGVGGILRDIFTMGARPIALMNVLRFGEKKHPRTKYLLDGVVRGIGGYGNCIGIPTVGGETYFHKSFNGNILVNAMAIGLVNKNKIFYSAATGINNPVIYVGSKTGKDGVHGATMASEEFSENTIEKKPTVQVGDPFKGKLLLEACLELMKTDSILSIQDMGAAGLTSSSVEMAYKGNLGIKLDLNNIPLRQKQMTSLEIMLSESQERMLLILKKGSEETAKKIFDKWELDFAIIGKIIKEKKIILYQNGKLVCNLPINLLTDKVPRYNRKYKIKNYNIKTNLEQISKKTSLKTALYKILGNLNFASKKWIYEQYDSSVMGDTILTSNECDSSVLKIHGSEKIGFSGKGIAISTDCTSRYVHNNPKLGSMHAVVESFRNICCSGARPIAVTNNLNFGNPEKVEIMGQIVGAIQGLKKACEYFDTPIVSGNVSLYNETNGKSILPTPVIGMVGMIDNIDHILTKNANSNEYIYILGQDESNIDNWLSSSLYQEIMLKKIEGKIPPIDLAKEKKITDILTFFNKEKLLKAAHDVSDGGFLPCLFEMLFKNTLGIDIQLPKSLNKLNKNNLHKLHPWFFGESQARILISTNKLKEIKILTKKAGIKGFLVGMTNNTGVIRIGNYDGFSIKECYTKYSSTIPKMMNDIK